MFHLKSEADLFLQVGYELQDIPLGEKRMVQKHIFCTCSGENVLEGMGVTGYILDGILVITSRRETDFALPYCQGPKST